MARRVLPTISLVRVGGAQQLKKGARNPARLLRRRLNGDEADLVQAFGVFDPLQRPFPDKTGRVVIGQEADVAAGQDQGGNGFLVGGRGLAAQTELMGDFHVRRVKAQPGIIVVLQFLPTQIPVRHPEQRMAPAAIQIHRFRE